MRECDKYEITVEKFMNFINDYTTPFAVHIVSGKDTIKIPGLKQFEHKYIIDYDDGFLLT